MSSYFDVISSGKIYTWHLLEQKNKITKAPTHSKDPPDICFLKKFVVPKVNSKTYFLVLVNLIFIYGKIWSFIWWISQRIDFCSLPESNDEQFYGRLLEYGYLFRF